MRFSYSLSLFAITAALLTHPCSTVAAVANSAIAQVTEFPLAWPKGTSGSTHELTYNHHAPTGSAPVFWITGQTHDALARVSLDGQPAFFAMPDGSGPHGIQFDIDGRLWVTLEFAGQVVQIDQVTGAILKTIDVSLHAAGAPSPINTHPHGLGVAPDGRTLWFTGKATGTVGRIDPATGAVTHYALPTVGSVPIYITAGPDGAMWCTELVGNHIARVTADGVVTEYLIPTPNSRPIAITPGPDGRSLWFSEEAGGKIGRIDTVVTSLVEYPVPFLHGNSILASLAFDRDGNLWTQAYINPNNAYPAGSDALVKLDRAIVAASAGDPAGDISSVPFTYYEVPSQDTVMHRIVQGSDGAIWFTELAVDKLGRLQFIDTATAAKRPPAAPRKAPAPQTLRSILPKPEFCG
jgi:virginiamycin B lyase